MAKKRETKDTAGLVTDLQQIGYFRKTHDRVQVGLPDILGCLRGHFFGVEAKSITAVPRDGLVPERSSHCFDNVQKLNLVQIEKHGGTGLAVVICGQQLCYAQPHEINEYGQIPWRAEHTIEKENGKWPVEHFLRRFK